LLLVLLLVLLLLLLLLLVLLLLLQELVPVYRLSPKDNHTVPPVKVPNLK
jgi:hypothetical protein